MGVEKNQKSRVVHDLRLLTTCLYEATNGDPIDEFSNRDLFWIAETPTVHEKTIYSPSSIRG